VEDVPGTPEVGQGDLQHRRLRLQQAPELANPLRIRPVSPAHRERRFVQPDAVPALQTTLPTNAPEDGEPDLRGESPHRLGLAAAGLLPHLAQDQAAVAHDRGIPGVERIEAGGG